MKLKKIVVLLLASQVFGLVPQSEVFADGAGRLPPVVDLKRGNNSDGDTTSGATAYPNPDSNDNLDPANGGSFADSGSSASAPPTLMPVIVNNANSNAGSDMASKQSGGRSSRANGGSANSSSTGYTPNNSYSSDSAPVASDPRLRRVEQQLTNLTVMNLPQKMQDMQQQIHELWGQLQEQKHEMQLLNQQLRLLLKKPDAHGSPAKDVEFANDVSDANTAMGDDATDSFAADQPNRSHTTDPAKQPTQAVKLRATNDNAPMAVAQKSKPVLSSGSESDQYRQVFGFLSSKQYDSALAALQNYLKLFPQGKYSAHVHYWLGEIALLQNNNQQALDEFSIVIKKFPQSDKMADARLKVATIHAAQGLREQARSEFQQVKQKYVGSTAAQLASIQLQQLHDQQSKGKSSILDQASDSE